MSGEVPLDHKGAWRKVHRRPFIVHDAAGAINWINDTEVLGLANGCTYRECSTTVLDAFHHQFDRKAGGKCRANQSRTNASLTLSIL